ncbi:MAG: methyltransferase domain-containing protein [Caulobacterales bacterium]
MRSFAERSCETEWMDGDHVDAADFAACLADLARANTATRARPPTLAWLARATRATPAGGAFSLLDVGYGHGDMLRAVHAWAIRQGLAPTLYGVDLNPRSEPAARAATQASLGIDYRTGDVFDFARDPPIDFVISSLVTHHMSDGEVVRFIKWMETVSRKGWFINDLHRHPIAFYGFKAIASAAGWHRFVRHDGPISVARSFRTRDWDRLLARAGVDRAKVTVNWRAPFRLCVGRIK